MSISTFVLIFIAGVAASGFTHILLRRKLGEGAAYALSSLVFVFAMYPLMLSLANYSSPSLYTFGTWLAFGIIATIMGTIVYARLRSR